MSHDEHQHSVGNRSVDDETTLGSPLSSSPPSDTADLPPPPVPPSHHSVRSNSIATRAAMQVEPPPSIMERWAAHASDSQFNALAGAVGGFTSGIVTCPLDVIKTKLQAQGVLKAVQQGRHVGHHQIYKGLLGTAKIIWKDEGIRGMYRGLGPIILGYLPTWAVWFTVYNNSKVYFSQYHENTFVINFWSSIVAGASSTIVTNPIWVIKTRLMSQSGSHSRHEYSSFPKGGNTPTSRPTLHSPWHYRSTLDAARKMYSNEGLKSFYSGLTPALLGLTHVAVQFPAYEYLKTRFTGQGMGGPTASPKDNQGQWFGVLSASILSKVLASSATYPHEVIRTRLQTQRRPVLGQESVEGFRGGSTSSTGKALPPDGVPPQQQQQSQQPKYKGIVTTVRTIFREEGWRAFYAGMGTNMMRAVPAATVTMLTYEYVMRQLQQKRFDARELLDGRPRADHERRAP